MSEHTCNNYREVHVTEQAYFSQSDKTFSNKDSGDTANYSKLGVDKITLLSYILDNHVHANGQERVCLSLFPDWK